MLGARLFVAAVFGLLALSFLPTTISLLSEFGAETGFALAALYSHTFLFFPTIGVVALIAFYIPAVVFVDFYWRHVHWGRARFLFGTLVVCGLSIYIAGELSGNNALSRLILRHAEMEPPASYIPALWELDPQTFANDPGEPANCATTGARCIRQSAARAVATLQQVSRSRIGLSAFARDCADDPLLEPPLEASSQRYCFPLLRKADAPACCAAQRHFAGALSKLFDHEEAHSRTRQMHAATLPFKTFFMLVLLIIGILLAAWRRRLDLHYAGVMTKLENGVLIGATAMLFWPICNQAFLQSAAVLYGPYSGSSYQELLGPVFSIVFGLWALLILFFFFRHVERDVETWVRVVGALASVVAVAQYDKIVDYAVRVAGSGASELTFPALFGIGVALYLSSFYWPERKVLPPLD